MSDDDEIAYIKRPRTIHYGSLEEAERQRQQALENIESDEEEYEPESKKAVLAAASAAVNSTSSAATTTIGNVQVSSEYFDLEAEV